MPLFARAREDVQQPEVEVAPAEPRRLPGPTGQGATGRRSVEAHREHLLGQVPSLAPLGIGLLDAAGLALCESIVADLDLPTFTAATTDGWALRTSNLVGASEHLPVVLPVVEEVRAGGYRGAPLAKGTAVRVAAGAPVPEGADAVVALADGIDGGEAVKFTAEAHFQQNLLVAGSRISDGDELVPRGTVLTPRVLGLVAELGHDKVLVRPRPRVVVLTADSALVEPGLPLTRLSETYDACTTLLAATARADGAQVFAGGVVPAEPKALATALGEQLVRADLVLLVTQVTDELLSVFGGEDALDVAEVDAVPGRQLFALVGPEQQPVLVLPPGAVPAYLAYRLFGRPLVQRLAGAAPTVQAGRTARLTCPVAADPSRTRLVLGRLTEDGIAPLPVDEPGAAELAAANAVLVVPPGAAQPAFADVSCWSLD